MSTLLKYTGNGKHVRSISKKDFKSVGFDHDAINVDTRKDPFVEVSDDVADWLLSDESTEKADWKEATQKEVERYKVRTGTADEAKADQGVDAGAAAGSPVTTGGSNTAAGAGSSTP